MWNQENVEDCRELMENGTSASLALLGGLRCSRCPVSQSSSLLHQVDVKVSNTTGGPYFVAQRCSPSAAAIAHHQRYLPSTSSSLWPAHPRWCIALFSQREKAENRSHCGESNHQRHGHAGCVRLPNRPTRREPVPILCLKTSLSRGDDRPRSLSTLYASCRGETVKRQVSVSIFPCNSPIFQ